MKKNIFNEYSDFFDDDFLSQATQTQTQTKTKTKRTSIKRKSKSTAKTQTTASTNKPKKVYNYSPKTISRGQMTKLDDIDELDFLYSPSTKKVHTKQKNTVSIMDILKKFKFSSRNTSDSKRTRPLQTNNQPHSSSNIDEVISSNETFSPNISSSYNARSTGKLHIIIDQNNGNYTLLDSSLNVVASIHSNPALDFFTHKHKLKKFKSQLTQDYNAYQAYCENMNKQPNPQFKKMYKLTKFYLMICPDADYQILKLLRNNITKLNPSYLNYQTACAEYLYELARYTDGDSSQLSFDINYFCAPSKFNSNNHKYISNRFECTENPVQAFRNMYLRQNNAQSEFQSRINYDAPVPPPKFSSNRSVRTPAPQVYDRD